MFFFFSFLLERYLNRSIRICLRINECIHMKILNGKIIVVVVLVGWNSGDLVFFPLILEKFFTVSILLLPKILCHSV